MRSMAKNYPRNYTVLIFVICLLFVLGTFVLVDGFPSTKNSIKYQNNSAQPTIVSVESQAGEASDWQKQFFDKKSDQIYEIKPADTTKTTTKEEPLNPTELFGRNFFTKYVELKKSGLDNDPKAIDSVTSQLMSESFAGITAPKTYSASNIRVVVADPELNASKIYAQELMKILKEWMPEKNEAEIAMMAFESGDMTLLKGIDPIISGYKKTVSKLLLLPVVQPLAQYHLDLINGISVQTFNAEALRNSDKDPLTGLAAISMEIKSLQAISGAMAQMQNYFAQNQIVFSLPVSGAILQSQ